jgi:hypothetical protein
MAITCNRVRDLASGFVLGALDAAEMSSVREHIATCRAPHPELRELGGVVPYLAVALEPVEPPSRLRAAVLAAAEADLRARRPIEIVARQSGADSLVVSLASVRRSRSREVAVWLARAAAAVAIVGIVGYGVSTRPGFVIADKAKDPGTIFGMIGPESRSGVLDARDGSEASGVATIMPSGHLIVGVYGLQPTRGDQVYVVWLSAGSVGPLPAATFTVDETGQGHPTVDTVPGGSTLLVSVSREPKRGCTEPLGPTLVSGVIYR